MVPWTHEYTLDIALKSYPDSVFCWACGKLGLVEDAYYSTLRHRFEEWSNFRAAYSTSVPFWYFYSHNLKCDLCAVEWVCREVQLYEHWTKSGAFPDEA